MRLLITGGAGFIGANFARRWAARYPTDELVVLDKLTYAGNRDNLAGVPHQFIHADLCDAAAVAAAMAGCQVVVHFAAESHVDRSLQGSAEFLRTAVDGTHTLLEAAREHKPERFVMISTDEVYGPVLSGHSREADELLPSSPYAASKVAAERLAYSYWVTYAVPVVITRSSNNYGPYQYPEKQLPFFATQALDDQPIPIYGDGGACRDWLHVDDNCAGIEVVLRSGALGGVYNIGAGNQRSIIENARLVLDELGKPDSLLRFVANERIRPGHDARYSVDASRLADLGWAPTTDVEAGLRATVRWYAEHRAWWEAMRARSKEFFERHYGQALKG